MDKQASNEKLTMQQRLEMWRAAKLQESKMNKKSSPLSNQRRKTFALSMLPSPVESSHGSSIVKPPTAALMGKRDRKAMSWKDKNHGGELGSPDSNQMNNLSLTSPSPNQEARRQRIQKSGSSDGKCTVTWESSPPSPIQLNSHCDGHGSASSSPYALCSNLRATASSGRPSRDSVGNNNSISADGYVTANEDDISGDEGDAEAAEGGCMSSVLRESSKTKPGGANAVSDTRARGPRNAGAMNAGVSAPGSSGGGNDENCINGKLGSCAVSAVEQKFRPKAALQLQLAIPSPTEVSTNKKRFSSSKVEAQVTSLKAEVGELKESLSLAATETASLKAKVEASEKANATLQAALEDATRQNGELSSRLQMAREDTEAMMFACSVSEQRVCEVETLLAREKIHMNETVAKKSRRCREECDRSESERAEYETRANALICELQGQLQCLQESAMARIESLEEELVTERRKSSDALAQAMKSQQQRKSRKSLRDDCSRRGGRRQSSFLPPPTLLEEEEEDDDENVSAGLDSVTEEVPANNCEANDADRTSDEVNDELNAACDVSPKANSSGRRATSSRRSVCILPGGVVDDIDDLVDPVF